MIVVVYVIVADVYVIVVIIYVIVIDVIVILFDKNLEKITTKYNKIFQQQNN